jgi:DNA/RNA non-specific endonuclease
MMIPDVFGVRPMMTRFFSRAASVVLLASALTLGLGFGFGTAHAVDANNPDTVERQVSLVFMGEMYDEDEKNQSPAGEFWDEPAPFQLVVRRYKNTYTLGYFVEIIDPEPLSHPLAVDSLKKISRFSGGSKFSNSDSISNPDYCKGLSDLVSPGTEPGRFRTKVHCTSPFVATVESGYFFVSKLDAHGDSSSSSSSSSSAAVSANTRAKFPDDTQCLPKRKGTVYEPVIQIDKGGVTYPLGKPSLYGLVSPAGADPKPANKWQFTAVAKDPETNENMPFGFDYRWTVSSKSVITTVTRQSATFEETIEATYGIGRFYPKLEIWKTHERTKNASGAYVYTALSTPVLVAKAEIHSLAVENTPTDNVVVEVFDQASAIFGTRCMVSNDVGGSGQAVDAKIEIVGSGDIRGRVTLDGYPQNEYWATSADNEDLYQVDQCIEGATSIRIQGYKKPSASDHDLKLKVAGQTFIEACIADYRFKGGPVVWSWTPTDSEPFMSSWMVKVPDVAAANSPEPQPPVVAATGSTVTVRFEKYVDISPAPSALPSDPTDSTATGNEVSGDLIRYILKDSGVDITQTLEEYLANKDKPQTRTNKIAITAQRYKDKLLELDLEIGPDVTVGWYHADANWGADHAYVSSETVYGSSGTFRMKEALCVVGIEIQEENRDATGHVQRNSWAKNFTIEQSKPKVFLSAPYDGQMLSSQADYQGTRQVAVAGTVFDLANQITGSSPTLSVNGQPIALSGSGGNFSFSGTVTVAQDGLITAISTDSYGNQGADEVVISRLYQSSEGAHRPINPPETASVLSSVHGYIYRHQSYTMTPVGAGYSLLVRDVVTNIQTTAMLSSAGAISVANDDGTTSQIPVFASSDGAWIVEVSDSVAGDVNHLGSLIVRIQTSGTDVNVALIETTFGSHVYASQMAEVTLTSPTALSSVVGDTVHVVIYKPFSPIVAQDLLETGPDSNVFTGANGVVISLRSVMGYPSPAAVLTVPSLGLLTAPVMVTLGISQPTLYTSQPLVLETSVAVLGGPPAEGTYREYFSKLPLASVLPEPRAKRIVMRIPGATAPTKIVKITTDQGTSHDITLTKDSSDYHSEPLFYEVSATGNRVLGGFPTIFDTTVDGNTGDPPVKTDEDVGGDVIVELNNDSGRLQNVVVRRIPNGSDEADSELVKNGRVLPSGVRVNIISGVVGDNNLSNRRKWMMRLDKVQWKYLNLEAEAALAHSETVDATASLEAAERAALIAELKARGICNETGWRWVGPRSFNDLKLYSAGFAVGSGQVVNETINPWEIVKGMAEMASFIATTDFSQIEGGELIKRILMGDLDDSQAAALRGDQYQAGVSGGRFFLHMVQIPIGGAIAAPAISRKIRSVLAISKVTDRLLTTAERVTVTPLLATARLLARRIQYTRFNIIRNRPEGTAKVFVDIELLEAKAGERAQQISFPGVPDSYFTKGPNNKSIMERGHIIGNQFSGHGGRENLVPLYWDVNQRFHKEFENEVASLVRNKGKVVEYSVEIIYGDHPSIPTELVCIAKVDGKVRLKATIKNEEFIAPNLLNLPPLP